MDQKISPLSLIGPEFTKKNVPFNDCSIQKGMFSMANPGGNMLGLVKSQDLRYCSEIANPPTPPLGGVLNCYNLLFQCMSSC